MASKIRVPSFKVSRPTGRRSWFIALASVAALWGAAPAVAMPARVLVIRHGEKNGDDDPHLSDRGQQRAQALVQLFARQPDLASAGLPVAIFAASPKHFGSSVRPIETVTPLAQSLHLTLNENYTKNDVAALAFEIANNPAYDGKMVLICWEHETIEQWPVAFGWSASPQWPSSRFDRVWDIDFAGSRAVNFKDLSQNLLPGDDRPEVDEPETGD